MYGAATEAGLGMPVGSGDIANAKQRESHVATEMGRLMKASEYLHQMLSDLESRISAITRPDGPTAEGAAKDRVALVPLANGLSEVNARIEQACGRIRSLTQRIEL